MVMLPPPALWVPPIHSYGAMLVLAWVLGWWLARRRARRLGIATWHVDWLMPLLLVSGGLGSRLGGRVARLLSDGGANDRILLGGLLATIGVVVAYGVVARIPLGRLGDVFAFSLPLGIALLRIGCFCAGCCWGDICAAPERLAAVVDDRAWLRQVQTIPSVCGEGWPLRVRYAEGSPAYYQHLTAGLLPPGADRSLPVHPVQLYEATAALLLLGLLWLVDKRLRRWGESFLLFGLGYCAVRFTCEWFRADSPLLAWDLTLTQFVCVGSACVCAVTWLARRELVRRGHGDLLRHGDAPGVLTT